MTAERKVVLLMGPTAAGKTDAALAVHRAAAVDIVSVDSAMVYRGMDIGTAKPAPEVREKHPHALVDVAEPSEGYSVARFAADADAAVRASFAAGRTPLLVGGTMLYFRAFRDGLDELPAADPELRRRIAEQAAACGWPALHAELERRDPAAAAQMAPTNGPRIQRALEVLEATGRSITAHWGTTAVAAGQRLGCELVELAIVPDERAHLHRRIDERLDAMLRMGFVAEVRRLRADPRLSATTPAMRAVGYREVWRHLDGDYSHGEMVAKASAATRQAAKRQLSWLRRWRAPTVADAEQAASAILRALE